MDCYTSNFSDMQWHRDCSLHLQKMYCVLLSKERYVCLSETQEDEVDCGQPQAINTEKDHDRFHNVLTKLLDEIQIWWRESSTSILSHPPGDWALERLSEAFKDDIVMDFEMAQNIKLDKFLKSLWEDGKLIMYPDFLMNSFSQIASQVLLNSKSGVTADFRDVAFKLIRSPIELHQVNKGHRADIVFKCLTRFVEQHVMLDYLIETEFDAHTSLTYAVTSPHNYTRMSAAQYFCTLVTFAFEPLGQDSELIKSIQKKLEYFIIESLNGVSDELISIVQVEDCKAVNIFLDKSCENAIMCGRYCKLVADCCLKSFTFQNKLEYNDGLLYDYRDMLKSLGQDESVDCHEFLRPSLEALIQMEGFKLDFHDKLEEIIWCFCKRKDVSIAADVIYAMAQLCESHTAMIKPEWMELAVLPLSIACGRCSGLQDKCPEIVEFVKATLDGGTVSQSSTLIQTAVRNIKTLIDKDDEDYIEVEKPTPARHFGEDFLNYLLLKTLKTPAGVTKPFLTAGAVSVRPASFRVLLCVFEYYLQNKELVKNEDVSTCIQEYSKVLLQQSDLNYKELDLVLQVYTSSLLPFFENVGNDEEAASNKAKSMSILQEIAEDLNKKMVNPDARVREVAVKAVGMLYLQGSTKMNNLLQKCNSLTSMCHCLKDLNEDVAIQTLNVLHLCALKGSLDSLIKLAEEDKESIEAALMKFLQSHKWDSIKSIAFKLLAQLSHPDKTVAYAEMCLRQANSQLSNTVLEHAGKMFLSTLNDGNISVDEQVDTLVSWLEKGWGDLVLYKANAHDTTSFRIASDIMLEILNFMNKADVVQTVKSITAETYKSSEFTLKNTNIFYKKFDNFSRLLGTYEHNKVGCQEEPFVKKRKISETSSESISKNEHCSLKENTCVLCLLASLNSSNDSEVITESSDNNKTENLHDSNASRDNESFTLDSTKELLPLTLRTEPFPLTILVKGLTKNLDPENSPEILLPGLRKLLYFISYREVLVFLNPQKLCYEAQRSTDVYAQNPATLLHDLETTLERSFKDATERIEDEIGEIFVKKLPALCDSAIKQTSPDALNDLATFIAAFLHILKDRKELTGFVLKQRRLLLKKPVEFPQKFTTNYFLKRLDCFKKQGSKVLIADKYFQSQEGLYNLLIFHAMHKEKVVDLIHDQALSENQLKDLMQEANSKQLKEAKQEREKLLTLLNKHTKSEIVTDADARIASLPLWSVTSINSSLETYLSPLDVLKDKVDNLVKADKRKVFQSLLDVLYHVAQHLLLKTLETKSDDQQLSDGQLSIVAIADQVHNWFMSEDDDFDSDGDNDPTLIDCY